MNMIMINMKKTKGKNIREVEVRIKAIVEKAKIVKKKEKNMMGEDRKSVV